LAGHYVIFEGPDLVGKSTTMHLVAEELRKTIKNYNIVETYHPGSTPLGAHLRKLVKFPHQIDPEIQIDNLSRQMLYMVDTVSFIKLKLEPLLKLDTIILSDRSSFISAMAYGIADGLKYADIKKLFDIVDTPQADRVYVLQCPHNVLEQRRDTSRDQTDHYDKKDIDFKLKLASIYNNLIVESSEQLSIVQKIVDVNNLKYINANRPSINIVNDIVDDISKLVCCS